VFSLDDYDFELPESLIAQVPAEPRDSSRLLVVDRASGRWEHKNFRDLADYLDAKDHVVANNTRVLKARLLGTRLRDDGTSGGQVEFVLLEELAPLQWEGVMKASGKYLPGFRFQIPSPEGQGLSATLIRGVKDSPHGTVVAQFDRDPVTSGITFAGIPVRRMIRAIRLSMPSKRDRLRPPQQAFISLPRF
jgi:S-adenosylmethionine:tRNA ribosyltransferase-isomerase